MGSSDGGGDLLALTGAASPPPPGGGAGPDGTGSRGRGLGGPERRPGGGGGRSGLRPDRRRPHAARHGRPAAGQSGSGGDRALAGVRRASLPAGVVIGLASRLGRAERQPEPVPVQAPQPVPEPDSEPVFDRRSERAVIAANQVLEPEADPRRARCLPKRRRARQVFAAADRVFPAAASVRLLVVFSPRVVFRLRVASRLAPGARPRRPPLPRLVPVYAPVVLPVFLTRPLPRRLLPRLPPRPPPAPPRPRRAREHG